MIETQFILVVGDKGSGKSNIHEGVGQPSHRARRPRAPPLREGRRHAQSFAPGPRRCSSAAHHAEGWAWDAAADLQGRAAYMDLAEAVIPIVRVERLLGPGRAGRVRGRPR